MTFEANLLYVFLGVAAASSVGVLMAKNVLHATLWLLATMIAIAAVFILLQAEFLGATQLLVYAAGVIVLLLFGIMITARKNSEALMAGHRNLAVGITAGLGALFVLVSGITSIAIHPMRSMAPSTARIGYQLLTIQLGPFELTGLLLLVSLLGATLIATYQRPS